MSTGTRGRSTPQSSNDRNRPSNESRGGTPKPKNKRRKSTKDPVAPQAAPEPKYFEISGILSERRKKGKTEYKVAWADINPQTGTPYLPSWQPAENVTDEAIVEWKIKKAREAAHSSSQLTPSSQENQPPQLPQIGRKRGSHQRNSEAGVARGGDSEEERAASKRRRSDGIATYNTRRYPELGYEDLPDQSSNDTTGHLPSSLPSGKQKGKQSNLVVELPSNPPFDRSAYRAIPTSSQSTQNTGLASSSQANEPHFEQRPAATIPRDAVIPDSQEISETTNSGPRPDLSRAAISSTYPVDSQGYHSTDQNLTSASDIPSRQLTKDLVSLGHFALNTVFGSSQSLSQQFEFGSSEKQPHVLLDAVVQSSQRPPSSVAGQPVFLTQLAFDANNGQFALPTQSLSQTENTQQGSSPQNQSSNQPISDAIPFGSSQSTSQAAQLVPALVSQNDAILTQPQTQRDIGVYNEDDIVPETVLRQTRQQPDSQSSSQALTEVDGNPKTSSPAHFKCASESPTESSHISSDQSSPNKPFCGIAITSDPFSEWSSSSPGARVGTSTAPQSVVAPEENHFAQEARRVSPEKQPSTPTKMDGPTASPPPLSASERLKQIQSQSFSALTFDFPPLLDLEPAPASTEAQNSSETTHTNAGTTPALGQTVDFSPSIISPSLLDPSVEAEMGNLGAIEDMGTIGQNVDTGHVFPPITDEASHPNGPGFSSTTSAALGYNNIPEEPATLNPSALSLSIEDDLVPSPSMPTEDGLGVEPQTQDLVPVPEELEEPTEDDQSQEYSSKILPDIASGPNEFVITLFLVTTARPVYAKILREYGDELRRFNSAFTTSPYRPVESALVLRVDEVLNRLFDVCDLPPFLEETLQSMRPDDITNHVRGTNSKFAFVAELLEQLASLQSQKKILILARPGQIVDLLNNVVKTGGYQHVQWNGGNIRESRSNQHSLTVIVASTSDDLSALPADFDAVVAFDHTFRHHLLPRRDENNPPVILALVTTATIQHINMRVSDKVDALERKNMLLIALQHMMEVIEDPLPHIDFSLPHTTASKFAKYIEADDEDYDDDFHYKPEELPERTFEYFYASSQADATQSTFDPPNRIPTRSGSRKRSLDDNVDDVQSKRPKITQPQIVTSRTDIPQFLQRLVGPEAVMSADRTRIDVPVASLEAFLAKHAKLRAKFQRSEEVKEDFRQLCDRSQNEVKSCTKTVNSLQPKYMAALKERGTFEAERNLAQEKSRFLSERLESIKTENANLKRENIDLKRRLTEATDSLTNGTNPDLAKVALLERNAESDKAKIAELEKKLKLVEENMDYAKDRYQEASNAALQLRTENTTLGRHIEELERKADDNIVKVNQIQKQNETRELERQIREERAMRENREAELNRVHQELRTLKANRRETRQNSVPRSPRLGSSIGMMSPRNAGRAAGGAPASSRGTSPASIGTFGDGPGVGFFGQTPGNGRYAHLRD